MSRSILFVLTLLIAHSLIDSLETPSRLLLDADSKGETAASVRAASDLASLQMRVVEHLKSNVLAYLQLRHIRAGIQRQQKMPRHPDNPGLTVKEMQAFLVSIDWPVPPPKKESCLLAVQEALKGSEVLNGETCCYLSSSPFAMS